jgi:hypothetical protein
VSTNPRDFLLRVLPWPGDDTPGFINMHAQMHMADGKTPWTGTPTRDVDTFLQVVHRLLTWHSIPDVYMCLSRQSKTKPGPDGKERAARHQVDALALKAIWLDVDVKAPPGGYVNLGEAVAAVDVFVQHYKLPPPSALVHSGGGLHVYWISDRDLTPEEWLPYAEGLKQAAMTFGLRCDAGVTVDSARVLRVPGTFNTKNGGRRPVKLLAMQEDDYDFSTALSALPAISPMLPRPTPGQFLPGETADPAFNGLPMESLALGIERADQPPVALTREWVQGCGWLREALATGGREFSQGLWNLTTLAATFMENGHVLAHKMAKGYPAYDRDETEALWDRKLAERHSSGLGWPSCKAIQNEGCTACATCPHLARGKSPLHLGGISRPAGNPVPSQQLGGTVGTPNAVATYVAGSPGVSAQKYPLVPVTNLDLPDGFVVIQDIIHKVVNVKQVGQPPSITYLPMFHANLFDVWVGAGPPTLNFVVSTDKGSYEEVHLPEIKMNSVDMEHVLLKGQVLPVSDQLKYMKGLMTSWLAKLQRAAAAHRNAPFGWSMKDNVCQGFSYGSILYKANGTQGPVGMVDAEIRKIYTPCGDVKYWFDAFNMILSLNRPGLETLVATSFGSPLMVGTSEYVGLVSLYGETSAQKTTAMQVALGVWANPKLAKENESATENAVFNRLGQIVNLPYMWDEIKEDKDQERVYQVLYRSGGKEKARLFADISTRPMGTWENIICIASNRSFADYVLRRNPDTSAGLVRLFEWQELPPVGGATGMISSSDAGLKTKALEKNFGEMGKRWSAWLGQNYDVAVAHTRANAHWFEDNAKDPDTTRNASEERFWVAFCAATLSGAELAKQHLGLNFNVVAMRKFLLSKLLQQRGGTREDNARGGSYEWTEDLLTAFLKVYRRNTLRTGRASLGRPGSPHLGVDALQSPFPGQPTQVQWALEDNLLMFSLGEMHKWLGESKSSPRLFRVAMVKHFGAKVERRTLGAGTNYKENNERLYIVPVVSGTTLYSLMIQKDEDVTAPVTPDTAIMFTNPDAGGPHVRPHEQNP